MVAFVHRADRPLSIGVHLKILKLRAWSAWIRNTFRGRMVSRELADWAARAVVFAKMPDSAMEAAVDVAWRIIYAGADNCPHCVLASTVAVAARETGTRLPPPPACPSPRRPFVAAIGQAVAGEGA